MPRFLILTAAGTAILGAFIYMLARTQGLDLLDPQVRMIGALALVTAIYGGVRIAMVASKLMGARETGDDTTDGTPKRSAFRNWGRSSALDARMDARRARVAAAKARAENSTDEPPASTD